MVRNEGINKEGNPMEKRMKGRSRDGRNMEGGNERGRKGFEEWIEGVDMRS